MHPRLEYRVSGICGVSYNCQGVLKKDSTAGAIFFGLVLRFPIARKKIQFHRKNVFYIILIVVNQEIVNKYLQLKTNFATKE